ncbi:hypothetical protein [Micromonospora sp. NPDC049679]|uniref:hypothetical protein n=1 Tax=Micromonospora sp. NPDC049679 TaxID=3155920 RepID=UPI0033C6DC86
MLALPVFAACDDPAPTDPGAPRSTPPGALPVRPLRLPTVAAGAECPTTPRQSWSGPGVATAVLGGGPLYPVADYFMEGTVLELRDQDAGSNGSYVKKVRWISTGYIGPVLVRAGRIDGKGTASVTFSYRGEERDGGHYADLSTSENDIPATTVVDGPGCYAYQVDGATFSTTIVFRAAREGAVGRPGLRDRPAPMRGVG